MKCFFRWQQKESREKHLSMKNTSYEHTTAIREKLNSIFNRLRRCKSRAATGRAGELLQWERLGGADCGLRLGITISRSGCRHVSNRYVEFATNGSGCWPMYMALSKSACKYFDVNLPALLRKPPCPAAISLGEYHRNAIWLAVAQSLSVGGDGIYGCDLYPLRRGRPRCASISSTLKGAPRPA